MVPGFMFVAAWLGGSEPFRDPAACVLLAPDAFRSHIEKFNGMEPERVVNEVSNAHSWEWLEKRIPFFECPDSEVEEIYYFRWWALRKHLKRVGAYWVFTEFIELDTKAWFVPPERTIASALGHHIRQTRWLKDQSYDDSFVDYWTVGSKGGPQYHFHRYSSWLQHSLWERAKVTGDFEFLEQRFEVLFADYERWKQEQMVPEEGLFWSHDVWDAMEESISGSRQHRYYRPTLNSYMAGNAEALAKVAERIGKQKVADALYEDACSLRGKIQEILWNPKDRFFEVVHPDDKSFAGAREAIGYIPWYFGIPESEKGYGKAWDQLIDPDGFWAPKGITTAERRHPDFRSHGVGSCEWDGAVWPFATSQTLVALGNFLRDNRGADSKVSRADWVNAFLVYTRAQNYDGLPYIGEYHDEETGAWLKGRNPRSYYYHHSTYADLLIEGLVGLRPQEEGNVILVDPLLANDSSWDWFCLDGVFYRGHVLTIFWDRDGSRYGKGAGFHLWVDGQERAVRPELGVLRVMNKE